MVQNENLHRRNHSKSLIDDHELGQTKKLHVAAIMMLLLNIELFFPHLIFLHGSVKVFKITLVKH